MPGLQQRLTDVDVDLIKEALDRLHMLLDRYIPTDKRDMLADELSRSGYPLQAIIAGVQSLKECTARSISLGLILDEVRSKIIPEREDSPDCPYCHKVGHVQMDRPCGLYRRTLACTCPKGRKIAAGMKMPLWAGDMTQSLFGELCVLSEWNRPAIPPVPAR